MNKLDCEIQANDIIRRVFDDGSWEDILEVIVYYAKEKVVDALIYAPYLKQITIVFASRLFHIFSILMEIAIKNIVRFNLNNHLILFTISSSPFDNASHHSSVTSSKRYSVSTS